MITCILLKLTANAASMQVKIYTASSQRARGAPTTPLWCNLRLRDVADVPFPLGVSLSKTKSMLKIND